jgi:uncharacterized protein YggT (Ycf19 family)
MKSFFNCSLMMKIVAFYVMAVMCSHQEEGHSYTVAASVFMPYTSTTHSSRCRSCDGTNIISRNSYPNAGAIRNLRLALRRQQSSSSSSTSTTRSAAMAIPGYGIAEQVVVGGFGNFLSIYNLIITARILLSWFPQAASVGALQPVYAITDPYLNLFRGIVPPLFGLDFSPILAFFLLNVLTNATAAVGAELPTRMMMKQQQQQYKSYWNRKCFSPGQKYRIGN